MAVRSGCIAGRFKDLSLLNVCIKSRLVVDLVRVRGLGLRPKGSSRVGFWASLQVDRVSHGPQGGCVSSGVDQ